MADLTANVLGNGFMFAALYGLFDMRREFGPRVAKGFLLGAALGVADSALDTIYPRTR